MVNKKQISDISADFLFPRIFQSFRMAIQPGKLTIGFLAIAILCLAGWIMDTSKTVVVNKNGITELHIYVNGQGQIEQFIDQNKNSGNRKGVFTTLWHFDASKLHSCLNSLSELDIAGFKSNMAKYFTSIGWAFKYHFFYCVIFFLIELMVISIAGGALCRIAALQFAQDEKPGIIEALRFSGKNFFNFFIAPLTPIGIIIFIAMFVFFFGLITNIPVIGELIMGLSMPLALIAGALITWILIVSVVGFGLMFPAVAYDGSDCFDAMGRAWHYISTKPWRMGFYTIIAAIYGTICYIFVRLFVFLLLWITHRLLLLGIFVNTSSGINKLNTIWPEPSFVNLYK